MFVGLCSGVATYPNTYASYPVPVMFILSLSKFILSLPKFILSLPKYQFRLLPYRLVTPFGRDLRFAPVQCMGHPKPPFGLLMLPGVTPAHEELSPPGLSLFYQRT